ncbi:MAG TPA: type II 3-dehydroquinate dehydratase [Lachnospiraceae bacterium]|jgi:3-dehydroquinate dehydratase-2|nr:type II 3-dehydroquinate dehydratase [Lachnospiraceae bacterium]
MKILVLNGPNLNFLGIREKDIYGTASYNSLVQMIQKKAQELNIVVECYQSNHEGAIIDKLQQSYYDKDIIGVVINPGAYTHYSYAIHDALRSVFVPKVEVHISDINSREAFRKVSVTAPACDKQIVGHGFDGYLEAMEYICSRQMENEDQAGDSASRG